jgi:NADH-quinone oxidoreductase subunit M
MGSIILAAGILKLAIYGIYRFLLKYLIYYHYLKISLILLCLLSLFYISFSIQRLTNLKQIIASSSIIHIAIGLIGLLYITNLYLYLGGLLILLHHSLLSCFFFFIAGEFKNLTNSLDITMIKSISKLNNKFFIFIFYGLLVNISFPISFAFISELIYFSGLFLENIFLTGSILIIIFFNTIYSF